MTKLHERLVALQSTDELRRKREKAWRKGIWTQEDIDYADRAGGELYEKFRSLHQINDRPPQ